MLAACLQVKWFSPFLLAVYDRDTETFQSLCRCISGFTDEFYAAAKERLSATIIPGPKPYYNTGESPSVWFEPTEVWEVRGADLSISPVHRAAVGLIHPDRGMGLRFPRCVVCVHSRNPCRDRQNMWVKSWRLLLACACLQAHSNVCMCVRGCCSRT